MSKPTVIMCDGHITTADQEIVDKFAEFLAIAGPPGKPGIRQRFIDADRLDLLDWALCNEPKAGPSS